MPSDRWIWLTEYNNENGKWSAPLKMYAPRPFAADNNSIFMCVCVSALWNTTVFVMGSAVTKEFNVKLCVGREYIGFTASAIWSLFSITYGVWSTFDEWGKRRLWYVGKDGNKKRREHRKRFEWRFKSIRQATRRRCKIKIPTGKH